MSTVGTEDQQVHVPNAVSSLLFVINNLKKHRKCPSDGVALREHVQKSDVTGYRLPGYSEVTSAMQHEKRPQTLVSLLKIGG